MAINTDDNEYQFSEFDLNNSDPLDELDSNSSFNDAEIVVPPEPNPMLRNIAILAGIVIAIIVVYKIIGAYDSSTVKKEASPDMVAVPTVTQPQVVTTPVIQQPVVVPQTSASTDEINQKLSNLESSQQNMSADLTNNSSQINSLNSTISSLNTKLGSLTQSLEQMTAKLEDQSNRINQLIILNEKKKVVSKSVSKPSIPQVSYHIQAVIPGRAWLIASNGSTLTIREGTRIPGYGTVQLIDPNQGRILTTSGRIIRFSAQDS